MSSTTEDSPIDLPMKCIFCTNGFAAESFDCKDFSTLSLCEIDASLRPRSLSWVGVSKMPDWWVVSAMIFGATGFPVPISNPTSAASSRILSVSIIAYWLILRYLANLSLIGRIFTTNSSIDLSLVTRIFCSSVWSCIRSPSEVKTSSLSKASSSSSSNISESSSLSTLSTIKHSGQLHSPVKSSSVGPE